MNFFKKAGKPPLLDKRTYTGGFTINIGIEDSQYIYIRLLPAGPNEVYFSLTADEAAEAIDRLQMALAKVTYQGTAASFAVTGTVHLDGVKIELDAVDRMNKGWFARVYGQPAKASFFKLRRDAVSWIVRGSSLTPSRTAE